MINPLVPTEEAAALAGAVRALCADHHATATDPWAPGGFWDALAAMGVLGLGSPDVGGGPAELVAAHRELGRAGRAGPFAGAVVGSAVLPDDLRPAVADGTAIVSVTDGGTLAPWGAVATVFVELAPDGAWLCDPDGAPEPVPTLAGEPWARLRLRRRHGLRGGPLAVQRADLAVAAYLAAAGQATVATAADYARQRRQFGRPIGDNQAVAHRLADAHMRLAAADNLVGMAAALQERQSGDAGPATAAARSSALAAALAATYAAHQTAGALGMAWEYPLGTRSVRIRQAGSLPPAAGSGAGGA
ncbi:MAG TPA: acyl-CoA dehydrogenase family protein [Acidimicrobiales bacterium]|nr:acyl-CoA dehydrogenase family protein [Acidimicrobiales bacterium]